MVAQSKITVRYAETDKMGIVHHAVYPVWYEIGRTDFIKEAGMPYSVMEQRGVMTPLTELYSKYFVPAHYEEELIVETSVSKISAARIVFEYKVISEKDNILLAQGATHHGFVDATSFRPVNMKKVMPQIYQKIMQTIEE